LGRVIHYDRQNKQARIKLEDTLRCGDGIEIWVTKGGRQGLTVNKLLVKGTPREEAYAGEEAIIAGEAAMHPGDRVFKTYDGQLMSRALESFRQPQRRIPLRVKVTAVVGEPLVLEAADPDNNRCRVATEFIGQVAERRPLTQDLVYQQLNRLGNTVFCLDQLEFDLAPDVIIPVSELNQVRRKMVAELEEKRLTRARGPEVSQAEFRERLRKAPEMDSRPGKTKTRATIEAAQKESSRNTRNKPMSENTQTTEVSAAVVSQLPRLSVAVGDLASAWAALVAGADQIYLPEVSFRSKARADRHLLDKLIESGRQRKVRLLATLPRIMAETDRERVQRRIEEWEKVTREGASNLGWLVGNPGGIELLLNQPKTLLYADYPLNCFNTDAVQTLLQLGLTQVTLSPELNYEQLKAFAFKPAALEVIVHGSWPLMVSEHCVVGAVRGRRATDQPCQGPCPGQNFYLKDRLGFLFPVEMDENCRMYLYNPKVLDLIDNLDRLTYLGFGSLRLEVRRESPEYVRETVQVYREELNRLPEVLAKQAGPDRFGWTIGQLTDRRFTEAGLSYTPLATNRERLKRLAPAGLTRGHFYRGVVAVE
jgi:putative protease